MLRAGAMRAACAAPRRSAGAAWQLTHCRAIAVSGHCQSGATSGEAATPRVKTGVLMMNMGGPEKPEGTEEFLRRLFKDVDIIDLGGGIIQKYLGEFICKRRAPKVAAQYELIGGSPIGKWTKLQGEEFCKILDRTRPQSAPHKAYTGFRYVPPYTEDALAEMQRDGVEHAVAFSQFPQWSCTTTGSSMNELWRQIQRLDMGDAFKWSVIDRWPLQAGFLDSVVQRLEERMLSDFTEEEREKVVVVFSAHSVPMKVVAKGDHYVPEVAATVRAVMERWEQRCEDSSIAGLTQANKYVLAWQSKVGFLPWMTPSTAEVLESLGKKGHTHVLVCPIAFTSDHIETLFEIGIEYKEDAEKEGITNFAYTEGLNGLPRFIEAQADIVAKHLDDERNCSTQYRMKCLKCTKPFCRKVMNPAFERG